MLKARSSPWKLAISCVLDCLGIEICSAGLYGDDLDGRSGWRRFLRPALRFVLALVGLLVLDAVWMQLLAPLLGIHYFDTVETIQVLCLQACKHHIVHQMVLILECFYAVAMLSCQLEGASLNDITAPLK